MEAGSAPPEQPERRFRIGQTASLSKKIAEADLIGFACITGDFNPVHLDIEYANQSRFKGRIAHGALYAGLISAVLGTRLPGPGCIYLSQQLKYLAPVFIGDTVEATVEIAQLREDKPIIVLKTTCQNQRGERVVDGEAVLLADGGSSPEAIRAGQEALRRSYELARSPAGIGEAVQVTETAVRHYLDDSASISRRFLDAWSATTRAGLRNAFEFQNASMQASRNLLASAGSPSPDWLDTATESVRRGQDATTELVTAGFALVVLALWPNRPARRSGRAGEAKG